MERVQFSFFKTGKFFMQLQDLDVGDVISARIGTEVGDLKKCVIYTMPNPKVRMAIPPLSMGFYSLIMKLNFIISN